MSLGSNRVMQTGLLSNRNIRNMLHHLLVHLHQGTKMSLIIRIQKISELDLPSHNVVWHMEVMGLLYVLSVVGPSQKCVMMAPLVASSMIELHLEELFQGQVEDKTVCVLLLVAKSKRIH
ncbi:hypothetical protein H5410_027232 [Solanum commersonii]|uniref:Uncharacterized protein n=1 Tax=Solanum commersonii TaxID=4109 RepID=A0A9J5Z2U8_SOLCO|nr:hypothetical protein H5410_027232 [Solanum commersonii]